jgi:hypothetical protein
MPLVRLFGVNTSDVLYTVSFGAITIGLVAKLLATLDRTGVAPLSVERRAILVVTCAFGSVLLILVPAAGVWYSAQVVGWGCVLAATISALAIRGKVGYFATGLALACATATRVSLLFNGVWLAYYLLRRDRQQPLRQRLTAGLWGIAPVLGALVLLGWYNWARFGSPLETGLAWHDVGPMFREDFEHHGVFSLHYLPTNLYHHFATHPLVDRQLWFGGGHLTERLVADPLWMGGSLFWMTPVLLGAPYAVWIGRGSMLVWSQVLSCILIYIPIGLLMGTGFFTFGPRYLLDLMVPLLVLTAMGIRRWRAEVLWLLLVISCGTYSTGSLLWLIRSWSSWWS